MTGEARFDDGSRIIVGDTSDGLVDNVDWDDYVVRYDAAGEIDWSVVRTNWLGFTKSLYPGSDGGALLVTHENVLRFGRDGGLLWENPGEKKEANDLLIEEALLLDEDGLLLLGVTDEKPAMRQMSGAGEIVWERSFEGLSSGFVTGVTLGSDIVGIANGYDGSGAEIARVTSAGEPVWAKSVPLTFGDEVSVDGAAAIGKDSIVAFGVANRREGSDVAFAMAISGSGDVLWKRTIEMPRGIAVYAEKGEPLADAVSFVAALALPTFHDARSMQCEYRIQADGQVVKPSEKAICKALWHQRNALFDAAGYCFRSERGKQVFDNAGCTGGVPGEDGMREVTRIKQLEQDHGC